MNENSRIMVVDDDQEMSTFLNCMLEQEGFDTVVMTEADSATNIFDNIDPDLVILEISPSEEDSLEILDLMRKHSDVPIIVLSSNIETESLRRAFSHGADDYIRMPFGIRSFMARIRAKLRRSQENMLLGI
jgi:DNA-binding response OmpR family regulator